jgi:F-type H+-transporting ATPase subunit gamma
MKMVSAAKLRKAQDAILQMRPYANKLHEILLSISENIDSSEDNVFAKQRAINKVLIVSVSSNRGLCGAFNSNVVKRAIELAEHKYPNEFKNGKVDFLSVGKKAFEMLKSKKQTPIEKNNQELFDSLDYKTVAAFAEKIMQKFIDGEYDRIELVYNQFKNAGVQVLTDEQFLPIEIKEKKETKEVQDYIFEPSKEYIIEKLIPRSLKIQIYKSILDSFASEHGARMTAMHKATDNASEMLRDLKLHYNKARQASITNEILEIVGGAEALKG